MKPATLSERERARESLPAEPENGSEGSLPNDIPISLKASLVDNEGVAYRDFRKSLRPRWWRLWADLAGAYAVLTATLMALVLWEPGLPLAIPAAAGGALVCGYTIHFINNFFHEAAHYNVVPGRARNDLITNLLMGWMFGSSIALYRRVHFQHHRALGTTMDSENSYFDALRMRYLAEGLIGLKLLRSLRRHTAAEAQATEDAGAPPAATRARIAWTLIGAAVNLGLAALLVLLGSVPAAVAWLGGLLVVFPFLASLRQLLEHRSEDADPEVNYAKVDHGPTNRIFGSGPLASTLGSAGFNRHALHHWEPQVSYTRLNEIERYLLRTPAAELIRDRQTSYRDTFLRLLEL